MKLARVLERLHCDAWLMRREMHVQMSSVAAQHISGEAHAKGIMDMFGDDDDEPMAAVVDGIGIIKMDGVIGRKLSGMDKSSGMVDVDEAARAIDRYSKEAGVQAIVLAIDSPGGTVAGVPEMASAVNAAKALKPVVAYVDGMAASAAYWIASQCDEIVSTESGVVGSIGVYLSLLDQSRQFEMQGLKMNVIKSGTFKGMGQPGTSLTPEQEKLLQDHVNAIHSTFKAAVISGRGVKIDASLMEGQDFNASEAVKNKMADMVGTIQDAMSEAKKLARMSR